jgi:CDP-2,3-bis-(O-geranylgeranyl)-sn-glycerol synthase
VGGDVHELNIFLLLLLANASPIIAARLFGSHLNQAVDFGLHFNNKPLLGASKTWRGIIAALLVTILAAIVLHVPWTQGMLIALGAMLGDLLASFIKRRLGIPSSGMSLGLDQIPESLVPLLLIQTVVDMSWQTILVMVAAFFVVELILSRIGFILHIRKRPY